MPDWEKRFRAPSIGFPRWARDAPDRLAVASNEDGTWQVYAWDRVTGMRRRVTDDPIGVTGGAPTPDGDGVIWFHDATGDEVGRWMVEPFGGGERRPLVDGVADAWSAGLAVGEGIVVVGTADESGFSVHTAENGGPARLIHHHPETVDVSGLSRDGRILCLTHAEHGDTAHPALRAVDPRTATVIGDLYDGPGLGLNAAGWSPVAGDQRLAIVHEREGKDRPGIWDLDRNERSDIAVDLPGDVDVAGWWPDGSALLIVHDYEGRNHLHRLDLASGGLSQVEHPRGTIGGAAVRPDGTIWYRLSSGSVPPTVREVGRPESEEVSRAEGERAPEGRPYRSIWFTSPESRTVHQFVALPAGQAPHPTVMLVHGGPTWAYTDSFMPEVQAWVDHGFAVAMVNYRGSTGYGTAFRDALIGNPGFPEVEDVVAGLDALVEAGVADPSRVVVSGGSWGGYITLLAVGTRPQRWAAAVAAVPVADYVAAYEDEAPGLQAFDRTLFGGGPEEAGDLYRERSPLTYVDKVTTPVLIIAGDNDSRCPIRQVMNYVEALQARGGEVEVYRFDAGHGSLVIDERVRQMSAELAFVLARVDAPGLPDGSSSG